MTIKFYKLDASPPVRAVNMVLEVIGLKVDKVEVNTLKLDNMKPEYLKKNPLHTVPMIEDDDYILTDSHAINIYLITKYGGDKQEEIYPNDLKIRSKIHQFLFMDASVLFSTILSVVNEMKKGISVGPSEKQKQDFLDAYGFLEAFLQNSNYLVGNRLTLADISCVASVTSMDTIVPLDKKFVKVNEWVNRLKKESWYQKGNEPGLTQVKDIMENLVKTNIEKLRAK